MAVLKRLWLLRNPQALKTAIIIAEEKGIVKE